MDITYQELINIITNTRGTLIVGLLAHVDARAKKTDNPYGSITKIVRVVGFVGAQYEAGVIREGERQGVDVDFKAAALKWGEWLVPNKIIVHKNEYYLRTQSTPGNRSRQPAKVLNYRGEDGKYLSFEEIRDFLPFEKESKKQQIAGLQETIFVRTFAFSNIKRIRILGKTYNLIHEKPVAEQLQQIKDKLSAIRKPSGKKYQDFKTEVNHNQD